MIWNIFLSWHHPAIDLGDKARVGEKTAAVQTDHVMPAHRRPKNGVFPKSTIQEIMIEEYKIQRTFEKTHGKLCVQ